MSTLLWGIFHLLSGDIDWTKFYLSESIIDSKVFNHWPLVTGFEYLLKGCLDTTPLYKYDAHDPYCYNDTGFS